MKGNTVISRFALAAAIGFTIAAIGLLSLSYLDVRASTGRSQLTPVSVSPNSTHLLVVRWRTGPYDPDHDIAGNYVLWTLRPFRKVHWLK